MMLQPHSPSPSLSDLLITAIHSDSDGQDQTISPLMSADQDYSFSANVFEFSFHNPSCKMPSVPCIADELFLAGRLLPSNAEKPKFNKPPPEMDVPRKAGPRWYWLVFVLIRVPLPEMEVRDIKKRVKRKLANPFSEIRKSSAGWKLIRLLSCRAVESVAVTATVPMSMVYSRVRR